MEFTACWLNGLAEVCRSHVQHDDYAALRTADCELRMADGESKKAGAITFFY